MSIGSHTRQAAWGTTILRMALGLIFLVHGAQKLFVLGPATIAASFSQIGIPLPAANAYLVIAVELLGGIAMIAGLGVRVVGALFTVVMLVAIATVHGPQGFFLPNGYEFALVLLAASMATVLQGAGAFAVDNLLADRTITTRSVAPLRA
jgi:putative oxidoreductase